MKTNHFFSKLTVACFAMSIAFSSCDPKTSQVSIDKLSLDQIKTENYGLLVGREITLEGLMVFDGADNPMIVKNLDVINQNKVMDEKDYLRLDASAVKGLDLDQLFGATVQIKGKIAESRGATDANLSQMLGKASLVKLDLSELPKIIKERPIDFKRPKVYNICERYPAICEIGFINPSTHYAFLFSGGVNSNNAHSRYWNDLRFMYQTLKSKYGYDDAHIVLVYKDGTAGDNLGDIPVDFAASHTGVNDAFAYLKSKMDNNDQLFFFATNHGGGFNTNENINYGGISDVSGDEIDAKHYDEVIYYYNEADNITDDFFSSKIAELKYSKFVAVLEPCFSGGFLRDLRGSKNIVISAANEFEFSWAKGPDYFYDAFSYHFTSALNGYTPENVNIKSAVDTNGDGNVSMLEAYIYAKNNDTSSEHPLYEDDGDGVGTNSPSTSGEGSVGATTFLN